MQVLVGQFVRSIQIYERILLTRYNNISDRKLYFSGHCGLLINFPEENIHTTVLNNIANKTD